MGMRMNRKSTEIITEILSSEAAWDKKTRKLKYDNVIEWYREERAARFDDEVLYPRLLRAHRMLSVWCNATLGEDGWLEDGELSDALSDQLSGDSFYNVVGYPIVPGLRSRQYYRESYFVHIWDGTEWAMEEPTEEEILALGIVPSLVPSKAGQPALF